MSDNHCIYCGDEIQHGRTSCTACDYQRNVKAKDERKIEMNIKGKWYTESELEAYVIELEKKVSELEEKHWSECMQIAHYDNELKSTTADKVENVNYPEHYQGKHECIDVMRAMFGDEAVKGFCKCNAFKYRFRAEKKNGAEDIQKAEWYEDYLMWLEGEE